jgi:hypothetical protein
MPAMDVSCSPAGCWRGAGAALCWAQAETADSPIRINPPNKLIFTRTSLRYSPQTSHQLNLKFLPLKHARSHEENLAIKAFVHLRVLRG